MSSFSIPDAKCTTSAKARPEVRIRSANVERIALRPKGVESTSFAILRLLRPPGSLLRLIAAPLAMLWFLSQWFGALPHLIRAFPTPTYLAFIAPALATSAALPSAAAAGLRLLEDRDCGMIEHLVAGSERFSRLLFGMVIAAWMADLIAMLSISMAAWLGGFTPAGGLVALAALLPVAFTLSATVLAISVVLACMLPSRASTAATIAGIVALMLLASDYLLPASLLPPWIDGLAQGNPLAIAVHAARAAEAVKPGWARFGRDLAVSACWAAAALTLSLVALKKWAMQRLLFARPN